MEKKRWLTALLAVAMVLSIGIAAYAAGGFVTTYLPGTGDTVTNMPAEENVTPGDTYTVASNVPEREGYVFLGWKLACDEEVTYKLTYNIIGDLAPEGVIVPDPVTGIPAGGTVTLEEPLDAEDDAWTFIGWCLDEEFEEDPITEVTEIAADTDVYGMWVYTPASEEISADPEEIPDDNTEQAAEASEEQPEPAAEEPQEVPKTEPVNEEAEPAAEEPQEQPETEPVDEETEPAAEEPQEQPESEQPEAEPAAPVKESDAAAPDASVKNEEANGNEDE